MTRRVRPMSRASPSNTSSKVQSEALRIVYFGDEVFDLGIYPSRLAPLNPYRARDSIQYILVRSKAKLRGARSRFSIWEPSRLAR